MIDLLAIALAASVPHHLRRVHRSTIRSIQRCLSEIDPVLGAVKSLRELDTDTLDALALAVACLACREGGIEVSGGTWEVERDDHLPPQDHHALRLLGLL